MASETMRLAIKLWAVVLITLAFTLIVVNVLYTLLNAPNLTVTYFHAHHKDWYDFHSSFGYVTKRCNYRLKQSAAACTQLIKLHDAELLLRSV